MAELFSQNSGTLKETQLRKSQPQCPTGRRAGNIERLGNSRGHTKVKGGGAPHSGHVLPYSPAAHGEMPEPISHAAHRRPTPGQENMFRMNCSQCRIHTGAGEKCGEEGRAERSCNGLTTTPHSLSPPHGSGGAERSLK